MPVKGGQRGWLRASHVAVFCCQPDPSQRPPAKELLTQHPRLRSKVEQIERELQGERKRRECAEEQLVRGLAYTLTGPLCVGLCGLADSLGLSCMLLQKKTRKSGGLNRANTWCP